MNIAPRGAESGSATTEMANVEDNSPQKFFDDTGDRFVEALKNLSEYLPINVEYALMKAGDCDIVRNNRSYYERVPLIISAVMIVLGVIFAFFGEFPCHRLAYE
jgi:hypothetical protein